MSNENPLSWDDFTEDDDVFDSSVKDPKEVPKACSIDNHDCDAKSLRKRIVPRNDIESYFNPI